MALEPAARCVPLCRWMRRRSLLLKVENVAQGSVEVSQRTAHAVVLHSRDRVQRSLAPLVLLLFGKQSQRTVSEGGNGLHELLAFLPGRRRGLVVRDLLCLCSSLSLLSAVVESTVPDSSVSS